MTTRLLIDTDVLVYRVGFGYKDGDLVENIEGMDLALSKIQNRFPLHDSVLAISNTEKTFRHDVAKTAGYKEHRKDVPKPPFYHELRKYLIEELGATVSPEGYEADDLIGNEVNKKTDVIVSIDKDLLMLPAALHYNFVKDEVTKVKRPMYYFWHQMLTGDKADNIIGLRGIGEKRATELLEGAKVSEMKKIVQKAYQDEFGEKWRERFNENGDLLWIRRDYNKSFREYV